MPEAKEPKGDWPSKVVKWYKQSGSTGRGWRRGAGCPRAPEQGEEEQEGGS